MIAMAADLAREQTLFTAYGAILIVLIVAVCWLAHHPSSPRTSPAAEPESSPARDPATTARPLHPLAVDGPRRTLRLCEELDGVVVSLDAARARRGGTSAA